MLGIIELRAAELSEFYFSAIFLSFLNPINRGVHQFHCGHVPVIDTPLWNMFWTKMAILVVLLSSVENTVTAASSAPNRSREAGSVPPEPNGLYGLGSSSVAALLPWAAVHSAQTELYFCYSAIKWKYINRDVVAVAGETLCYIFSTFIFYMEEKGKQV